MRKQNDLLNCIFTLMTYRASESTQTIHEGSTISGRCHVARCATTSPRLLTGHFRSIFSTTQDHATLMKYATLSRGKEGMRCVVRVRVRERLRSGVGRPKNMLHQSRKLGATCSELQNAERGTDAPQPPSLLPTLS